MIERAGINVTAGDAREEEAEVFQGVEVVVDHVVANPPSVLVVFYILCQPPFFVNVVTLYKLVVHFPWPPGFGSFSCHSLSEENGRSYSNMRKSSVECFISEGLARIFGSEKFQWLVRFLVVRCLSLQFWGRGT